MDNDDNESQDQNYLIGGEGSCKFFPVLHSDIRPKFNFDDELQGDLRFDRLVENEGFLAIPSEEDNHWIEDFSQANGGFVFSSGAPETCPISRSSNVWSEAASSESVEMLLESIGQEEIETVVEESDACQKFGGVAEQMESHFKEDGDAVNVMDSDLALLSKKVADHGSLLKDAEGMSNSPGVDISIPGESHMLSPNTLCETFGVDGAEDNLGRRHEEENLSVVGTSNKSSDNGTQDPSGSNMHTEVEDNTVCLDNGESATMVTDVGFDSASFLLTYSVKEVKEDDVLSKEVQVDDRNSEGIEFQSASENSKDSCSSSNSKIGELCLAEVNVNKLDEPSTCSVIGSSEFQMSEECDQDVFASELNKGSECEPLDSSNLAQIHQLFDENIEENPPKDFQGDGNPVSHVIDVSTKKAEISTVPELGTYPIAEVTNRSDEEKVLFQGSDLRLVTDVSINNKKATMVFDLDNKVSDAQEGGTSIVFVAEHSNLSSLTLIQERKHSVEKSKFGDDASPINKGSRAEGSGSSPTALASDINSMHHDQVVSSNGEEKPMFPNDSSEMDPEIIERLSHEKGVGHLFNGESSRVNNEAVHGSECDAAAGIEPNVRADTPPLLYERGADDDLVADQTGTSKMIEKASSIETNLIPLKGTSKSSAKIDPVLEIEKGPACNFTEELLQEAVDHSFPELGTSNTASESEQTGVITSVTAGQSSPVVEILNIGIQAGQEEKTHQISENSLDKAELFLAMCDQTNKQNSGSHASDTPANHITAGKDRKLSSSEVSDSDVPTLTISSNNVLNESKGERGKMVEKSLVKKVTPAGSVESAFKEARQSGIAKDGKSFTFEIHLPSSVVGEHGQDKQFLPATQSFKSYKEASPFTPGIGPMESKTVLESSRVRSQALDLEVAHGGSTGTSVRKRGRPPGKATGKHNAKKRNSFNETSPFVQSGRSDNKSSGSTSLTETGQLRFERVKLHERFEHNSMVSGAAVPVVMANLPDLNTSAFPSALLCQQFLEKQQMQLRAQIFVYGSLIQGAAPDETCMVAAFGTSDGGRNMWEPVWLACVERLQGMKSNLSKSENPLQLQSGSNPSEQSSTKKYAPQSSVLTPTIGRASSKDTPSPVVSSMIPLSSPLWNGSTPFNGLQSTGMPRSSVFDYRQNFSHPFQTPPSRNVAGNNSYWPSRVSFPAPWITASQSSPFDASAHLPTTETVKLTPIEESVPPVASGANHSFPGINVHHSEPNVSVEPHPLPVEKTTLPSSQKSTEPKSRRRKKSSASENLIQIPSLTQSRTESVPASVPLLTESRTELVPAPVVCSHLSTSVVSTFPASQSSPFDVSSRLPTTEIGKFTPTRESIPPVTSSADNSFSRTTVNHLSSSVSVEPYPLMDLEKITLPSGQKTAEPKSRKRKTITAPENHIQTPLLAQAPTVSGPAPVTLPTQARIGLLPAPVVPSHLSTSGVVSTPLFGSKENNARIVTTASSAYLANQPKEGESSTVQKSNLPHDALIKAEEAKQQAEEAAALAAAAVIHSQTVWDKLNKLNNFGLIPEVEAKLASAAVAVAAAAAVAKAAAAAAQIASNAVSQAKMMADEVRIFSGVDNPSFNNASFISNMENNMGLITTSSAFKVGNEDNFSNSILVAAKEAPSERVQAALFASKRAENLEAIVKAAELAAAAVSQAGRIVTMGDPPSLAKLVEDGPEGYWRTTQAPTEQVNEECLNINVIQEAPSVSGRHTNEKTTKRKEKNTSHGVFPLSREVFEDSMKDYVKEVECMPSFFTSRETDLNARTESRASDLDKTIEVVPELESGSRPTSVAAEDFNEGMGTSKETQIRKGCLVEVKTEGSGFKEAWFSANVLIMENGKAFVSYAGSRSELKEWLSLEGDGENAPRIRIAQLMADNQFEGTRKRRRGAIGDCVWSIGDKVDVWMQECWREGVVTDRNKIDDTKLTVHFPAEGETSIVRLWHLRPTLIWKDGKWIESSISRQRDPSHKGDTPQVKRLKLAGLSIEGGKKDDISQTLQLPGPERPEELQLLPLSDKEKMFDVGNNIKKDNKLDASRTVRSGLQKEGPRVMFGIPKPGKKKKFMEVSKHYITESSNKTDKIREKCMMPKSDSKEKQQGELKAKIPKSGKLISSYSRTLPQKDKFPSSGIPTKNEAKKSANTDRSESEQQRWREVGSVSSADGAAQGPFVSSSSAPSMNMFKPNARAERAKRGNRVPITGQSAKHEGKNNLDAGKLISEGTEPRRSNRRIQPTSRLLEGLQSSLTLPKFPSFAHDKGQRSRNRGTPKGK